jgi:hypothetical protein
MVRRWLRAGVIERGRFAPTVEGTPQGSVISAGWWVDRQAEAALGRGGVANPSLLLLELDAIAVRAILVAQDTAASLIPPLSTAPKRFAC